MDYNQGLDKKMNRAQERLEQELRRHGTKVVVISSRLGVPIATISDWLNAENCEMLNPIYRVAEAVNRKRGSKELAPVVMRNERGIIYPEERELIFDSVYLAKYIEKFRKDITQNELKDKLKENRDFDISQQLLSKYEHGGCRPSVKALESIAAGFGHEVDYLVRI